MLAAVISAFTIQDVSRRSGLSEPTLRYYEEVGLIGPVNRDASSGHRRYSGEDVDTLQMLACLRDNAAVWDARDRGDELAEAQAWERVPTEEAPGAELPNLVIHNERAKRVLGWRSRPAEATIVETAESLRDLGLLEQRAS